MVETLCLLFVHCILGDKQALIMLCCILFNVQENVNNVSRIIANAKASQSGLPQGLAATI